ncbi:MAG TPA: hypothetical protein VEJ86_05585 [Candidatus Binataceae bacterium]|nr:hypothetical protein [Candidatus Binataceae bacterium]
MADAWFSSLGSGTFATAALTILLRPGEFSPAARVAFLITFPVMVADTVCLIFDLGDPLRFHHMLRVFRPGSAMSMGVWAIVAFTLLAFLSFAGVLFGLPDTPLRVVAALGLIPALTVSSYKGVLFSTTAQPAWRRMRWLGAALSGSAGAMGAAVLAGIAVALELSATYHVVFTLFAVLLLLNLIITRRTLVGLADIANDRRRGRFVLGHRLITYFGNLVPLLLINPWAKSSVLTWVAIAIVLLAALAFRSLIVSLPSAAAVS